MWSCKIISYIFSTPREKVMCINFETSIVSFSVGILSGVALIQQKGVKRSIGCFTIFFSLVQLCEAIIYYSKRSRGIMSRLLLLNLGFQGLVFALVFSLTLGVSKIFLSIFTTIAIITLWYISRPKGFKNVDVSKNCTLLWGFMEDRLIGVLLTLMYAVMFIWIFLQENQCCQRWGMMLFVTMLISYIIQPIHNSPSFWCLSSAIVSPLVLWLC